MNTDWVLEFCVPSPGYIWSEGRVWALEAWSWANDMLWTLL